MLKNGSALVFALVSITLISLLSLGTLALLVSEKKTIAQHKQNLSAIKSALSITFDCNNPPINPFIFIPDTLNADETMGVNLYQINDSTDLIGQLRSCRSFRLPGKAYAANVEELLIHYETLKKNDFLVFEGQSTEIRKQLKLKHISLNTLTPTVRNGTRILSRYYVAAQKGGFYQINIGNWPYIDIQYHYRAALIANPFILMPHHEGTGDLALYYSNKHFMAERCNDDVCEPLYELEFVAPILNVGMHYGMVWLVLDTNPKEMIVFDAVDHNVRYRYTQPGDSKWTELIYEKGDFYWRTKHQGKLLSQAVIIDAHRLGRMSQWWLPK